MGRLIDDLLAFSRLGRQPLQKQPVAPADLVRQALEELRRPGGTAGGDRDRSTARLPGRPGPAQAGLVNLLSNALKFTRGGTWRRIEVGCRTRRRQPDGCIYFVRDNGVGFDMQYADKLFGVFQRLHRPRNTRARAWAWRSCSGSSTATAGASGPRRRWTRAPHSISPWKERLSMTESGVSLEILLVEDNPNDVELTLHALQEASTRQPDPRRARRRRGAGLHLLHRRLCRSRHENSPS